MSRISSGHTTFIAGPPTTAEESRTLSASALSLPRTRLCSTEAFDPQKNPHYRDYRSIIDTVEFERRCGAPPSRASFAEGWRDVFNDRLGQKDWSAGVQEIRRRALGNPLLDLGGGPPMLGGVGRLQHLAEELGASVYVNVERYAIEQRVGVFPSDVRVDLAPTLNIRPPERTKVMLVQADMLEFLAAVPDASCNVTMNGIDGFIVHYPEYFRHVAREVARVLLPGGIAFGSNAVPLQSLGTHGLVDLKHLLPVGGKVSFFMKPELTLNAEIPAAER